MILDAMENFKGICVGKKLSICTRRDMRQYWS